MTNPHMTNLPPTFSSGQWTVTLSLTLPGTYDPDDNEGFAGVVATVKPWDVNVSDQSNTANDVSLTPFGYYPTLYLPENSSGNAVITIAGNSLAGQATWSISGSNANPATGTFSANQQNVTLTPSGGNDDFVVTVSEGGHSQNINVHVMPQEIDAETVKDNKPTGDLLISQKMTSGAFVPVDDGDFDYNGTADYLQATAPAGDDRLLPFVLKGTGDSSHADFYTLSDVPKNVKIWQLSSDGKSYQFVDPSTVKFNTQNDTTLFIQGISDTASDSNQINVDWHINGTTYNKVDSFKLTVIELRGPLDVPGGGIYQYTAFASPSSQPPSGPHVSLLPDGSQWVNTPTGTITTQISASNVLIRWANDAVIGGAAFRVNDSYQWDVDVNVVKITITQSEVNPTNGQAKSIPFDPSKVVAGSDILSEYCLSVQSGIIILDLSVTVQGAGLDGKRGLDFIDLGFIQNVTVTAFNATYSGRAQPRLAIMQGKSYDDPELNSTMPWANTLGSNPIITEYESPLKNTTYNFSTMDAPRLPIPMTYDDTRGGPLLTSANITSDFTTFLAARTTNTENSSDQQYVQLAKADWKIDLSGSVTFSTAGGVVTNTYTPKAENAIVGPVTKQFSPGDGTPVPVVTGSPALAVLRYGAIWKT
jgi:hypothetical protein